jgi:hypothetical protein
MQPHAIDLDEISHRRIPALSLPRVVMHGKGGSDQSCADTNYSSGSRHVVTLVMMRYHNRLKPIGFASEIGIGA